MKTGQLVIKNLNGGWIPHGVVGTPSAGLVASMLGTDNQYAHSSGINLNRIEQLNNIAPGETFTLLTDATPHVNAEPRSGATDVSDQWWVVLSTGRLVKVNNDNVTVSANYNPASTASGWDVLVLKDVQATPVEYVLWSWADATNADIAIIKSDGTGQTDTWYSTKSGGSNSLTVGVPHYMSFGPTKNDIFITNGQYIATATIAGTIANATVSKQALNLGSGIVANSVCNYGNYVAVVGSYSTLFTGVSRSESKLWLWNGFAPDPNYVFDIPDNFAGTVKNINGRLYVFTYGRNLTGKIYLFTGSGFNLVYESGFIQPSKQGLVESLKDELIFGNTANPIGVFRFLGGIHQTNVVTDGTTAATSIGMVKNLSQNLLVVGTTVAGPLYKLYKINTSGYQVNATWRSKLYELPYRSTVDKITVYFSQFVAASSVTLKVFDNYTAASGTAKFSQTVSNTNNPRAVTDMSATLYPGIVNLNSFYLNLTFDHSAVTDTGAIIREIVVDFTVPDKV